jgi:hypothetical protein
MGRALQARSGMWITRPGAWDEKVPISTEKVMLNGLAEVGYNAPP